MTWHLSSDRNCVCFLDVSLLDRGVADAGVVGVRTPALLKTAGVDYPEIWIFKYPFS